MILSHHGCTPQLGEQVFIAPSADVIGEVTIGVDSSVWFGTVIRGDVNTIKIGSRTNIQDLSMVHVTRRASPTVIGNDVTVAHRVMLHGCTVGDRVLVGMGAIIMDDAVIGDDSIVAAGSLVTKGKTFPAGHLIQGSPAKAVRPLKPEELEFLTVSAQNYVNDSQTYLQEVLPQ